MNIFDVIGPAMVGPSSSHTAGACRIGRAARRLLNEPVARAELLLHGSFATTGKGHGTDKALVGGLMGFAVDDPRIPDALAIAEKKNLHVRFATVDLGPDAHPNTVRLAMTGITGKKLTVTACSIGGGRIEIREIDGLKAIFSCDHPTLIVQNDDTPGEIAKVTAVLAAKKINIATMQLDRDSRGGHAVCVFELDQELEEAQRRHLSQQQGILKVTYFSLRPE